MLHIHQGMLFYKHSTEEAKKPGISGMSGLFKSRQALASSCADSSSLRSSQGFVRAGAVLRTAPARTKPCEEHGEGKESDFCQALFPEGMLSH